MAHLLDVKGAACPIPVLKAKKMLNRLSLGEELEVLTTDPGSVKDFEAFCATTGNDLLESGEDDGVFRYLIRKSA